MIPLNGTKTHPLTAHALGVLREIATKPVPSQAVNPGVVNRLLREALVEQVQLPSPFATHKGRNIEHLHVTDAGVAALGVAPSSPKPSAQGPAELWLQLHGDCHDSELNEPVDYTNDDVTWCRHKINASDVRYVRADLAMAVEAHPQETPVTVTNELASEQPMTNAPRSISEPAKWPGESRRPCEGNAGVAAGDGGING